MRAPHVVKCIGGRGGSAAIMKLDQEFTEMKSDKLHRRVFSPVSLEQQVSRH